MRAGNSALEIMKISIVSQDVGTVVVKIGKGNLRSGPSLRDDIVAKVDYSTVMQVEEGQPGWPCRLAP